MSKVSGSPEALSQMASQIQNVIQGLEQTVNDLINAYRAAGSGWNDSKYTQLGEAVEQAARAMKFPIPELRNAIQKIKKMEGDLRAYLES